MAVGLWDQSCDKSSACSSGCSFPLLIIYDNCGHQAADVLVEWSRQQVGCEAVVCVYTIPMGLGGLCLPATTESSTSFIVAEPNLLCLLSDTCAAINGGVGRGSYHPQGTESSFIPIFTTFPTLLWILIGVRAELMAPVKSMKFCLLVPAS